MTTEELIDALQKPSSFYYYPSVADADMNYYETKRFKEFWQLTDFLNKYKIQKENIVSTLPYDGDTYKYVLVYRTYPPNHPKTFDENGIAKDEFLHP